jgi:membrane fusion protein (multidrug efflux system)
VAKGALLVPQRAVSELQGAYQVATVNRTNHVHIVTVAVGDRAGSMWIITAGLHPGDRVVAEGLQKVREGGVVNPQPYVPAAGENDAEQK